MKQNSDTMQESGNWKARAEGKGTHQKAEPEVMNE